MTNITDSPWAMTAQAPPPRATTPERARSLGRTGRLVVVEGETYEVTRPAGAWRFFRLDVVPVPADEVEHMAVKRQVEWEDQKRAGGSEPRPDPRPYRMALNQHQRERLLAGALAGVLARLDPEAASVDWAVKEARVALARTGYPDPWKEE